MQSKYMLFDSVDWWYKYLQKLLLLIDEEETVLYIEK